tara:strand:+ start:312 stop:1238 length:927 start_codon:yes stop_codon:yes gene_type:complete
MINKLHIIIFSEEFKRKVERLFVTLSIVSFLVHLFLILINYYGIINYPENKLLNNPIVAIYTPFSFILVYEVFLVVYYLPRSISQYIRKQYEIITLIIVRRIFKDIANIDLTSNWFDQKYDLQLTYDLVSTLILFFIIYLYYYFNTKSKSITKSIEKVDNLDAFIRRKKSIALLLFPILIVLAFSSLIKWIYVEIISIDHVFFSIQGINELFFNDFFTVLIMADVLLLLISLYKTDKFNEILRNSGFIISTILIRLSFSVEGLLNNVLIVTSVVYGFLMLLMNIKFNKIQIKFAKEIEIEEKESDEIV